MKMLPLQQRRSVVEQMDAPDLDPGAHRQALAGLSRLNAASRAAAILARPILAHSRRHGLKQLGLLDVACGGGDVPVAVAGRLRRAGIDVRLTLCDRSPTALEAAGRKAERAGHPAVCLQGEAPLGLPDDTFDVVTNSLFLHHLWEQAVAETLIAMHFRARRLLVVSDLRRSAMGWMVAWSACRVLSRSPIVHYDGPVSVEAAYTREELHRLATYAGMPDASITRCWPWRMLLTWERP